MKFTTKSTPNPMASSQRFDVLSVLEGHSGAINSAKWIPSEDGIISVSNDRTLRVWLKRDSGQYWPSVCHQLTSGQLRSWLDRYRGYRWQDQGALNYQEYQHSSIIDINGDGTSLEYNSMTRHFFVGLGDGTIQEFVLSVDSNKTTHEKTYLAHTKKVTAIQYSSSNEWVLSTARDKYFQWHCSSSARRIGSYQLASDGTSLVLDEASKIALVGDSGGVITLLKLETCSCTVITELKGHTGSITCLDWDVRNGTLFSGSKDDTIICWNIADQKGIAYDLNGHRDSVATLVFANYNKSLMTASVDGKLVVWDMNKKRQESPKWENKDACTRCDHPFFWNLKQMWSDKMIGCRQHHCRKCGAALCDLCTKMESSFPPMGFEYPVRMCDLCISTITKEELVPLASQYELKHRPVYMDVDVIKKRLLTVGDDRVIKVWDISNI